MISVLFRKKAQHHLSNDQDLIKYVNFKYFYFRSIEKKPTLSHLDEGGKFFLYVDYLGESLKDKEYANILKISGSKDFKLSIFLLIVI